MKCPSCFAEVEDSADTCFNCGHSLATVLRRGSVVASRYEILNPLGKGGMGMVYKAHDRVLEEEIAIKVLRADIARAPDMARRFRSEIRLARKVTHRNVCRIHEYGEDQGLRYISMELIEGVDLKQVIRDRKSGLPPDEAFEVTIQVAKGLQAIHEVGIIHRDLKSANIMRDGRGIVKLMDFGIAKEEAASTGATAAGDIVGTPEYMSPEQARGQKVDARSDVYALAIVIYEIFSGDVPFRGDSPIVTIFKHIQDQPLLEGPNAPRFPASLIPVLRRGLAKSPDDRFATTEDVVDALRAARAQALSDSPSQPPGGLGQIDVTPVPGSIGGTPPPGPMPAPAAVTPTPMPQPSVSAGPALPAVAFKPTSAPPTPPPSTPTPQPAPQIDTAATASIEPTAAPLIATPAPVERPSHTPTPMPAPSPFPPPEPPGAAASQPAAAPDHGQVAPLPPPVEPPPPRRQTTGRRKAVAPPPVLPPPTPQPAPPLEPIRSVRQQTQRLPGPVVVPREPTLPPTVAAPTTATARKLLVPVLIVAPLLVMFIGVLIVGRILRSGAAPEASASPAVTASSAITPTRSPGGTRTPRPRVSEEVVTVSTPMPAPTPSSASAIATPGPAVVGLAQPPSTPTPPTPVPPSLAPSLAPSAATEIRPTPRPPTPAPTPTPRPAEPAPEQLRAQQVATALSLADTAYGAGRYDEASRHFDDALKLEAGNARAAAGKQRAQWAAGAIRKVFVVGRTVNLPVNTGKGPVGFDLSDDVQVKTQDFLCDIGLEISPPAVKPGGPYEYTAKFSLESIGKKSIKLRTVQAVVTLNGTKSEETLEPLSREVPQKQRVPIAELKGKWQEGMTGWSVQLVVTGDKGDVCRSTTNWNVPR